MTTLAPVLTAELCVATPSVQVLDNRGMVVRNLQYNRSAVGAAAQLLRTQQHYHARGVLLSSLDPRLGAAQQADPTLAPNFRYQASLSGQVLRTQGVDAGQQVTLVDIEGGPLWQQGSRGQLRRWRYDRLHRVTALAEQADPAAHERISEQYQYGEGRADAVAANARGQLVAHYDTAGLNQIPCYNRSAQPLLTVRQLLRDPAAESDWQGDAADWQAQLETTRYESRQRYNAQGAVVGSVDAKGHQQQQRLNIAGQLASSALILADGTPHPLLTAIRYSAAGQVQQETAGNGVVSDYTYEAPTQRLSRLRTTRPASNGRSTLLQDLNYSYDPVGNILSIDDAAQAVRHHKNQRIVATNDYQYDALYQLTHATGRENAGAAPQGPALPAPVAPLSVDPQAFSPYTRNYTYDDGGNLVQIRHQGAQSYTTELLVSPTSNRAVQQTGFLSATDVEGYFDAGGNLLQLGQGQALAWDGRNQLQRVAQVVRQAAADDAESYQYDGAGQRIRKTTVRHTSGTVRTAQVLYLPGLELRLTQSEHNGTLSTVEALQVIQAGASGRQSMRLLHWDSGKPADIPNDQLRGSLDNQIGSSLLELDQQADILTLEEYFPFGGTAVWSGKTQSETQYKFVRYSGKERDATGLYYYGFRYYAPWLGRWLNPDPAGTIDGLNLFRMVRNNPVTLNDLDGLMSGRGPAASTRTNSCRPVTRSGAAATVGQSGRGGVSRPTMVSTARAAASGAAIRSRSTARAPVFPGRSTHQGVATRGRTMVTGRPPVAIAAAFASPAVRAVTPPLAVEIGIATINLGEAATSFFDENLGTRLQNYKSANAERFLAVEEGLSFSDADNNNWIASFGAQGRFINAYKPHQWTFGDNWRSENAKYFAADVVVEQYTNVATQRGFLGALPTEVVWQSVVNRVSAQYMKDARESGVSVDEFFEGLMTKTVNGKSTKRILEVFGLEAYGVTEIPKEENVTLKVRQFVG